MIKKILKHKNQFWLLVAMLVAFALRVYALSAQSLWNDEGTSVALSSLSLEAITNGAARDIHPPLYYYLLHFWMPLVGSSEFAVRFLSVVAGVITVAVTFRIAYVFFDEEVAIIAAYLSAFSPFQVYYSQEARMYIWVTLFAAVSVYAMAMMLKRGAGGEERKANDASEQNENNISSPRAPRNSRTLRSLLWLLYLAATIAMLYTQYVGGFVVVAENIAFAVWFWIAIRGQRSVGDQQSVLRPRSSVKHSLAFWVAAQAIVGLVTLPWYIAVREQIAGWPSISDAMDLPTMVWRVLNDFSSGRLLDAGVAGAVAIAFGILFFIGWRRTRETNGDWMIAALILWTLVPVSVMYVISLSRPAYNHKLLLLATPAFFILAARGMSLVYPGIFLHRRHSQIELGAFRYFFFAIAVFVAVGFVPALRNYYDNPQYARDDYRSIVQFIDVNERSGDGILVNAPGQIDVVRYYHRGDQSLYLLPRMRPLIVSQTRDDVDAMLAKSKRLFAIYYATQQSDPQGIVENHLAEKAFKARDEWRGNVRLAIYGVAPNPRGSPQMLDTKVGDEITLASYQLDQREARTGDVLTLTLNWHSAQTPTGRYKVFAHLLDAGNQVVAQRDGEPVGDTRITPTWRAGEEIADNYGLLIESGVPPGEYRVEIGIYRAEDGARLQITRDGQVVGDHLIIGTVVVK